MSKVTVIIPVYNTELYIEDCIKSLQDQTYKNLEIIIINDNSNNKCKVLLEEIYNNNDNIKLFHLDQNKGVGYARNLGLEKATGEFVYFLDSDDYLSHRTLELLVKNINEQDIIRGMIKTTNFSKSFAVIFDGENHIKVYGDNKYNLIANNSSLNFLIRKSYVDKFNFRFSEATDNFTDLAFITSALLNTGQVYYVKEALYFKRRRNTPILNPSLNQSSLEHRIEDFLKVFLLLKGKYDNKILNEYLDKQFLNFYKKEIAIYFKNSKNVDKIYDDLTKCASLLDDNFLLNYGMILRREISLLRKNNTKKFKRYNNLLQFLRDFKDGLKSKEKFNAFIYHRFFLKLKPKEKLVFFESFQGKSYSDNPKYIYEFLVRQDIKLKCVWSVNQKLDIPYKATQVKRLSLRYFYLLARSKTWIINSRMPNYIQKGSSHIYLQTWHGTPLKRLAGDMENVHMPGTNAAKYKMNFYNETQKWNYLISPNGYSSNIFKRAFWFDGEMLEIGYPRNDILYNKNNYEYINTLKKKMNIPLNKKVILYAPTWRDDEYYSKGEYRFNLKLNLKQMQKSLGEKYVIILRMHYFISTQLDISRFKGFAYDLSLHDDIGELYLISDMLITDYSSVFFDYANLRRPILFFTYDLEKYRHTLRGFYIDMEKEVPGPLLTDTSEVIKSINEIEQVKKDYSDKYEHFYHRFCEWEEGNSSEKVVKKLFQTNLNERG